MNESKNILILGAGIAGCTTAIGLKKLGFEVTLIYKKRVFDAYEGFSEKTKEGLFSLGCKNASKLLETKSKRNSNWAEQTNKTNYEYVVCRTSLDKALIDDVNEVKIKTIEAKVIGEIDCTKDKPKISCKINNNKFELNADFIVDARGRFTPFKDKYICGPKSFSILQELELKNIKANKTSIDSVCDGWIWQAYVGDKKGYIQFSCDEKLAKDINNFDDLKKILELQSIKLWSLKNYKAVGNIVKRDSYSKIHKEIINDKMMLIGDSASSIDPLSGNGAFQAMSMSSIAPYVINTILNKDKKESNVAIDFYKKRVEYIFNKFTNLGKEFYCLEKRFNSEYWIKRQNWPNVKLEDSNQARVENSGIIRNGYVESKEVVVTKSNPLGVHFFDDFEIIDLVKYCLSNNKEKSNAFFENFCKDLKYNKSLILRNWLSSQNIL